MSLTAQLVEWAWSEPAGQVLPVRAEVARHMLDGLGCGWAAARLGEASYATVAALDLGGPAEATLLGGGCASAPAAALANGTLIHALDFDDTHADALVHVTAAVLPTALAVAEERRASGHALLSACVAGYEVVARLGAAVRHGFHARGFHATSVCGTFAAALVAARLMELDEPTAVAALGVAGSLASGSLEFLSDGSPTKQLHPGWSGHAGIMAARLAAAGARGPASILEGSHGLYRAYTGRDVAPADLLDGLGVRWEALRITIKPYPACQLSHAALDALATVRDRIDPESVEHIDVDVPADSIPVVCEPAAAKVAPRTSYDAKFSLPWCLAVLLLDGRIGLDSFAEDRLARRDARTLAARVRIIPFDPGTAAAHAPGRVRVHLRDGTLVEGSVPVSAGGPDRPLDDAALRAKLAGNIGDGALADRLADVVLDLDALSDLRPLTALLAHDEEPALP
jgi:2-methylcitrate dehydratase PrpD